MTVHTPNLLRLSHPGARIGIRAAALCATALLAGIAQADPLMPGVAAQSPNLLNACVPDGSILLRGNACGSGYVVDLSYLNAGRLDRGDSPSAGLDLRIVASLLLAPSIDAYAKLGSSYVTTSGAGAEALDAATEARDWAYGAGVQYHLSPTWSVNADWDQYRMNLPDQRDGGSGSLYSVGTRYRF